MVHLIIFTFNQKVKPLNAAGLKGKKMLSYLHAPWKGTVSIRFKQFLPTTTKHVLPSHHYSYVIISCATVIVGTLVARPKACKSVLNNIQSLPLIFLPLVANATCPFAFKVFE